MFIPNENLPKVELSTSKFWGIYENLWTKWESWDYYQSRMTRPKIKVMDIDQIARYVREKFKIPC